MAAAIFALLLSLTAAAPVFAAGKSAKPHRRRTPVKQRAVPAALPEQKPEPAAQPKKEATGPDSFLAPWGAELSQKEDGALSVLGVLDDAPASELDLMPGDRLTHLGLSAVKSLPEASSALAGRPAETRLAAVVLRATAVESLQENPPARPVVFERDSGDISVRERLLKENRLQEAFAEADRRIKNTPLGFKIAARQTVSARFPKGFPENAGPGDIVLVETTAPLAADSSLDFFSLPAKTQLWAKVLAQEPADAKNPLLFFFKMKAAGGGFYPISARAAAASEHSLEIEFLEPVVLTEPASYFQAGPGLWIKQSGKGFKIAEVILGRSADQAGARIEDSVAYIDGRQAEHFNLTEALTALYGKRGSTLKLGIKNALTGKVETLNLRRGVSYKDGQEFPLAPPYSN